MVQMIPIVMTAFGTTADALATYDALEAAVRRSYPGTELIRACSSRAVARTLQTRQQTPALHLADVLDRLAARGTGRVVVQSLHLFPGREFHRLITVTEKSGLQCAVGAPLLTMPEDYERLGAMLVPVVGDRPQQAILVLGHGTAHPTWTAYHALEKILRRRFGDRLFVGVVEKFPHSDHLPEEIAARGYTEVMVIPLFLVAGMHLQRDIVGNDDSGSSWLARLHRQGIAVTCFHHGLGVLPELAELVVDHIAQARDTLAG